MSADDARAYHSAGWSPVPLPLGKKTPPPGGLTGYRGRYLGPADLNQYDWSGNMSVRMAPDVIGVDVDVYNGGDVTLKELELAHGPLPRTIFSTSRDDGSRIAFYRVPPGTTLLTKPGKGIELIQFFHRYAVCWPSIHPDTGQQYQWFGDAGEPIGLPPNPGELPALPWPWQAALAAHKGKAGPAVGPDQAAAFIDAHAAMLWPRSLEGPFGKYGAATEGERHDSLVAMACWLAREAAAGWYPASEAFRRLEDWWLQVMADEAAERGEGEWASAVLWAIGQTDTDQGRAEIADKQAQAAAWLAERKVEQERQAESFVPTSPISEKRPLFVWEHAPDPFVIPPIEWLVGGLWCKDTHGELAGAEKTLKSYVGLILDVGIAAGVDVFGRFKVARPGRVLHLAGEGGRSGYWRRFGRVCDAYGVDVGAARPNVRATFHTGSVSSERFADSVRPELETFGPAVVHLDPWYAYAPTGADPRQLVEVGAALEAIGGLCAHDGASLLINNHFNSTGTGNGLQRITGAGHAEWCDSWLLVRHREVPDVPGGRFRLRLDVGSRQWGGTSWDLNLDIGRLNQITLQHEGAVAWTITPAASDPAPDPQAVMDAKVVDAKVVLLRKAHARRRRPFTKSELMDEVGGTNAPRRAAWGQLVEQGEIVQTGTVSVPAGKGVRHVPMFGPKP